MTGPLRTRICIALLAAFALLLAACGSPHTYTGTLLEPPMEVPAFELVDASGQPAQLSGDPDRLTLVFFGYTNCPDVCPLTMARMKQAVASLKPEEAEQIQVIFVTVDPARDTPEVVGDFVRAFDPSWVGLTGEAETLADVRKAYAVHGEPEAADHEGHADYLVAHTDRIFALTDTSDIRVIFRSDISPDLLAADLRALLRG